MESLKELYRIGRGPSSSHTMGPAHGAALFQDAYPDADAFRVIFYGSLAKTGKGHLTDKAIQETFSPIPVDIYFDMTTDPSSFPHPNTMDFIALKSGVEIGRYQMYSVGGGKVVVKDHPPEVNPDIYSLSTFSKIRAYCEEHGLRIWQYVEETEGNEIWSFLSDVWSTMKQSIQRGLQAEGVLHGGLGVQRKAKYLFTQRQFGEAPETREHRLVCAYAYAVSEESAAGNMVVTAPTCGASGVLPAVLYYEQKKCDFSDKEILRALATAGLVGNLIKTNASISGAECGCQAEIGSACCMASAALADLYQMELNQIEYAAEIAMEHHLGLTCDPIGGLVQIPCIERNAVAAMRAINAVSVAHFLADTRKISFDLVIETMYETGRDLFSKYRETSEGGLAKLYPLQKDRT